LALSPPLEPTPLDLGKALRKCREILKLKQWEVADRSGLGASQISNLEQGKGNPTFVNLSRVASGLGIDHAKIVTVAELYALERQACSPRGGVGT
jgi:transcriptional regulator with XRE-family HTH domain